MALRFSCAWFLSIWAASRKIKGTISKTKQNTFKEVGTQGYLKWPFLWQFKNFPFYTCTSRPSRVQNYKLSSEILQHRFSFWTLTWSKRPSFRIGGKNVLTCTCFKVYLFSWFWTHFLKISSQCDPYKRNVSQNFGKITLYHPQLSPLFQSTP